MLAKLRFYISVLLIFCFIFNMNCLAYSKAYVEQEVKTNDEGYILISSLPSKFAYSGGINERRKLNKLCYLPVVRDGEITDFKIREYKFNSGDLMDYYNVKDLIEAFGGKYGNPTYNNDKDILVNHLGKEMFFYGSEVYKVIRLNGNIFYLTDITIFLLEEYLDNFELFYLCVTEKNEKSYMDNFSGCLFSYSDKELANTAIDGMVVDCEVYFPVDTLYYFAEHEGVSINLDNGYFNIKENNLEKEDNYFDNNYGNGFYAKTCRVDNGTDPLGYGRVTFEFLWAHFFAKDRLNKDIELLHSVNDSNFREYGKLMFEGTFGIKIDHNLNYEYIEEIDAYSVYYNEKRIVIRAFDGKIIYVSEWVNPKVCVNL